MRSASMRTIPLFSGGGPTFASDYSSAACAMRKGNTVKNHALIRQMRNIATFYAVGIAVCALNAGCSMVSGQSSSWQTTRAVITELPVTADWTKPGNCHFTEDGSRVRGGYWSNQAKSWKSFEWTDQGGTHEVPSEDPAFVKYEQERKPKLAAWNAAHGNDWSSRGENLVALDTTSDGNAVVGFYDNETAHTMSPFVWRKGKGVSPLQAIVNRLPDGAKYHLSGKSYSITRDGSAVLCYGEGPQKPRGGIILVRLDSASAANALRLTGTVTAMSPQKWTLSVSSVTTADGKVTRLSPARNKAVLLPAGMTIPDGVKTGVQVIVAGEDGGKGKPLTAESVQKVSAKE